MSAPAVAQADLRTGYYRWAPELREYHPEGWGGYYYIPWIIELPGKQVELYVREDRSTADRQASLEAWAAEEGITLEKA